MAAPVTTDAAAIDGLVVYDRCIAELDPRTLYALLKLRTDVFVVEQACPYPELDGRDTEPATRHLWAAPPGEEAKVACYLRVLEQPDGHRRMGRVVTAPSHRGNRMAGRLLTLALKRYPGTVDIDAQAHLEGFYASLGFTAAGPTFLEDGILHVPMRRDG
ncbi:GNAT family N-acetyltransferase [soil metagenome]